LGADGPDLRVYELSGRKVVAYRHPNGGGLVEESPDGAFQR
jgi:hypothetical protein